MRKCDFCKDGRHDECTKYRCKCGVCEMAE